MVDLPKKPENSVIQEIETDQSRTYQWRVPMTLSPSHLETVTLSAKSFQYDCGSNLFFAYFLPWQTIRYPRSRIFRRSSLFHYLTSPSFPISISKDQLGPMIWDKVGDRHGLSFLYDGKEIEIGEFLSEPDRAWLASVITAWQQK